MQSIREVGIGYGNKTILRKIRKNNKRQKEAEEILVIFIEIQMFYELCAFINYSLSFIYVYRHMNI